MPFRRISPLVILVLALTLAACEGLAGEPRVVATLPPQVSSETSTTQNDIAQVMTLGGEMWANNCAECHGLTGAGTEQGTPLPNLSALTDEQILASITNGKGETMPAFGERLSADELTAAMTYARMMSMAHASGTANSETSASDTEITRGVVTGQINSGTEGAALPASLSLTLHVIKSEFTEEPFTVLANADGSYGFENVPFDSSYQYVITAPYNGVQFVSSIVSADPAQPELSLPITLYEGGAPESAVQVTAVSSQAMIADNRLQIIQIVSFVNTSDRVYFNTDENSGTSVTLRLPQNATLMNSVSDSYIISEDEAAITSTRPLLPGRTQAMHLAYTIPYGQLATVDQDFDYPIAGEIEVTVITEGLELTGEGFAELGQIAFGERQASRYGGTITRAAGSSLRYDVSGIPVTAATQAASSPEVTSPLAFILIGAGLLSLTAAAVITVRDHLNARKNGGKATMNDLLEQIAALDNRRKEGKVSVKEYQRKRAALKAELSALMKAQ